MTSVKRTAVVQGQNAAHFLLMLRCFSRPTFADTSFFFRAEYGEKTVQKLNLRIDNIMNDLVAEKMKTQNVNDDLDQTFELFINQ